MADWSVQETKMKMSIGNLGSCRCTKQTRQHLHFCLVACFACSAAPCVCALLHQCGRDSIGFDLLRSELAVIHINPDRSADTALNSKYKNQLTDFLADSSHNVRPCHTVAHKAGRTIYKTAKSLSRLSCAR